MRNLTLGLCSALTACASGTQARIDRLKGSLDELVPPTQTSTVETTPDLGPVDRTAFVSRVLARHPSVEAARLTVRAAIARVEVSGRLPDPMVSFSFAPLSIGSSQVSFGAAVELRQRLPLPGRIGDLEEVALLQAEMERDGADGVRRSLAAVATAAFDDLAWVRAGLELNRERGELVQLMKVSVDADYAAGRAPAALATELEMEALRVLRERWQLEAEERAVAARLNLLLGRPADAPPPPLVAAHPRAGDGPAAELVALEAQATAAHPELRAAARRVAEAERMHSLAEWESWPELELMTGYNSMWHDPEHRWMIGLGLSLPIFPSSRRGAREEAQAGMARAKASLEALSLEVRAEVHQAQRRLEELEAALQLYEDRMRSLARERLAFVRANVDAGMEGYRSLIEAERLAFEVELEILAMRREQNRRRDALTLAVGGVPGLEGQESQP